MAAKKSIFEKFKLVEKIEDTKLEDEGKSEDKILSESDKQEDNNIESYSSKDDEIVVANQEEIENNIYEETSGMNIDTVLSIEEIYSMFNLENENTKKVYIIDNFFNALPGNLPTEIKKQSVVNIINASGMNINALLKDGKDRVVVLRDYLKEFSKNTDEVVNQYQSRIKELLKEIEELKQSINKKENLQSEQKHMIEYEIQKINSIIESVK
ncbi:hypothetical protein [Clostridium sp. OS1-26]|uniref:hypothetical protein n=1 Tax=Clostridium sp. OS1-26 TaxID=3070681 RepID=UPI0027E0ADB6|nr:hypothetical protein [Clostridium sp. OS1-26]WML35896.1 hypothetical protein RCG18_03885 [Clostridium sp. OS1-26]